VNDPLWWHGAIIYQIYPRSFLDTNGDGIGDLPGITAKLDYVAGLGVDAIWISPFFKSPMADFGYDIADYCAVDPVFGTLADFDSLLMRAHALGLKVMIDQVLSHTSIEHAWFQASRESRDNAFADWYVWADAKDDGGPPNNWLSIFGGIAWKWEPRRSQYYLHNFLADQPDLNFHVPEVRRAALDNLRFWLERGVDGVRLDAINFCFHDALLRDNPPKPLDKRVGHGFRPDNPYAFQYHLYDNTQHENLAFIGELRAVLDAYPGTVALGEISSEDSAATMAEYTQPGRLHMAYSFELLGADRSPAHIRTTVERELSGAREGWPCWAISNHDVERVASRWGTAQSPRHLATQLTAMLCSLRGAVCVYQGEELGLGEAAVPFELLRDAYGIAFWPKFKGRDGCRTPVPWADVSGGGFTTGTPWLPVPAEHRALSVANQEADPTSALLGFRRFVEWRKGQPALRWGDIEFIVSNDEVLALRRRFEDVCVFAAFNLADVGAIVSSAEFAGALPLTGHGLPEGRLVGATLSLPAHAVFFAQVPSSVSKAMP
jgi:alpha-glucosidase